MYRFDNEQKEIHFDKYNTPTPWMNYLSNGVFHTMISHCGGEWLFINRRRFGGSIIIAFFICQRTARILYIHPRRWRGVGAHQ